MPNEMRGRDHRFGQKLFVQFLGEMRVCVFYTGEMLLQEGCDFDRKISNNFKFLFNQNLLIFFYLAKI